MRRMSVVGFVFGLGLFISSNFVGLAQSGPPALPSDPLLQIFNFHTNFVGFGPAYPIAYTNIDSVPFWEGDVLVIDQTNLAPAFLQYNVAETNGWQNLCYSNGSLIFLFAPGWASADAVEQGAGPGEAAYLLAGGDWNAGSPYGFFGLSVDPYGTNLSFWGLSNGVMAPYANTLISWSSNVFHAIDCEYSSSNSFLFVDGQLCATGNGVTVVPATNVWPNGLFIGSDANGYEQAQGAFFHLETWNIEFGGYFDPTAWEVRSNAIYNWQVGQAGGLGGLMMGMGAGTITSVGSSTNLTTNNLVLVNLKAFSDTNADGGMTFDFAIAGGTDGALYDLFATTNINNTNIIWTWLGEGTNDGLYEVTNQPVGQSVYMLGTPLPASDGSGLTQAYEALMHTTNSGGDGISGMYKLLHGLTLGSSVPVPSLSSINIPCCPIP